MCRNTNGLPEEVDDCMRADCKTSLAHGSQATSGTGGPPSPSGEKVLLTLDSNPSGGGSGATALISSGHNTYASVNMGPWGEGFTFTLSWAGLTKDQLVLIATALGMTGAEFKNHMDLADWDGASLSRLAAPVVRLSTAPSTPPRDP